MLLLFAIATGASAQDSKFWKTDVQTWLDGCVALAEASMHLPSGLETNCMTQATKYCAVGRVNDEIPKCQVGLRAKFRREVNEMSVKLEQMSVDLGDRRRRRLERRLNNTGADKHGNYDCPKALTVLECELVFAGADWLLLRGTMRAPWLYE